MGLDAFLTLIKCTLCNMFPSADIRLIENTIYISFDRFRFAYYHRVDLFNIHFDNKSVERICSDIKFEVEQGFVKLLHE